MAHPEAKYQKKKEKTQPVIWYNNEWQKPMINSQ